MRHIKYKKQLIMGALSLFLSSVSQADVIVSELSTSDGVSLGKITFEDSQYGLLIKPDLSGLPVGAHGFHIHQKSDCGDGGMNAGGHFDPANTNSHQGPFGQGHLGDLPLLIVTTDSKANTIVLAPRLKTQDIKGHALMIHEGGDNYSDTPLLGGGGARIACGKIPS